MVARRSSQGLLSDIEVRTWMRAGDPVAKSDGGGLTFTLSKAGTASWTLRYSLSGRRREMTLGNYPDMSLSEARKYAREMRVEVDKGKSPADEKRRVKLEALNDQTVTAVINDYISKTLPALSASTNSTYKRQLKRIKTRLGSLAIKDVSPHEVIALLKRHVPNGWREVEILLVVCRELFKHAAGQHMARHDPCVLISLEAIAGPRPPKKIRLMLDDSELKLTMNADMNRQNQLSLRLLLATAVRVGELSGAKKEDIHIDELTIRRLGAGLWRLPRSKTDVAMEIPLAPPVIEWFRELTELSLDSEYLLPARSSRRLEANDGDAPIGKDTIWGAVQMWLETTEPRPEVRRFTPHDLRSTAKSHMRALGVSRDISEMCLNHKLPGVEGIYDQYTYWKERKEALGVWAEHLMKCLGSEQRANRVAREVRQSA